MNKNKFPHIKTKHLITLMTILCVGLILLSATELVSFSPIRNLLGAVIVPFQNGINEIGSMVDEQLGALKDKKELAAENESLKQQIDELNAKNSLLVQEQEEAERLRALYDLDREYAEYDKVAAQVIGKDTGNWYSTFLINRGTEDGVETDMNVITNGGLVGIVTETGKHWAQVRSIIDDSSNVSATVTSVSRTCTVTGSLSLMESGKIQFIQLTDTEKEVQEGDKVVTSSVSSKFLKGILIGYIAEIEDDPNNLTRTGTIIPAVDFEDIQEVLVIKQVKQTAEDGE